MFRIKIILLIILMSKLLTSCQSSMPVIEKFSGNKKVPLGEKTNISWEVKNAKKIYLIDSITNERIEILPLKTKFQFKPTTDFAYTLVVESADNKTVEKKFSGKVVKSRPIIESFLGTNEYTLGEATRPFVSWKVTKAKKVIIANYNETVNPEQGKFFMPLDIDTTQIVKLIAIGEFGDTVTAVHTIKVAKLNGSIKVVSKFGSPEMIAEFNNVLTWDFPGAESIQIQGIKETFKANDTYIIRPKKKDRFFYADFLIKYPNNKIKTIPFSAGVLRVKSAFIVSKLKANLNDKIQVKWKTEGAKNVKLTIGREVYENQEKNDVMTFKITKNTDVKLEVTDMFDEVHVTNYLVRCESRRPFIKNAIDYQTFKNDDKQTIKKKLIFDIFQVDRSKFPNEIKLRILVTDTIGNFIRGLAPPSITEKQARQFFIELAESIGSEKQNITDFKVKEINDLQSTPYDVGLCLDYSGSMASSIKPLEEAVRKFLNKKDDDDRMSLIRFDSQLKTEKKMTLSLNELNEGLEWKGLDKFGGGTALYAGIDEALESFDSTKNANNRQKILFVFTDGHENSSFSHASKGRLFRAVDLARKARKRNIKIYPMGLGDGVNEELLNVLGWVTDGKAMIISNDSLIDEAYSELPRLFKNYYEITYKPINTVNTKEGKREIALKYFNNRQSATTMTNYQTSDNFSFDQYEADYQSATNNLSNYQTKKNQKIIVPPQAVAFFDFDKSNLKPKFTANITAIIDFLKSNKNAKADIFGHTDLVGTLEKNKELSKKRAEEIENYLIKNGIDKSRLSVIPLGKTKPIWKEEKKQWQAQENRRIEILIWE